jgi:vancomycin resistance protein YoaR
MSYRTATHSYAEPVAEVIPKIITALAVSLFTFFILMGIAALSFSSHYRGRIYPGVSVGGIDLSDLDLVEAIAKIKSNMTYPETGKIVFQDGGLLWQAKPADLGLYLDPENSALEAYNVGRRGNPLRRLFALVRAWQSETRLSPLMVFDEHVAYAYLQEIATQVNRPVVEASLSIKDHEVVAVPGQIGLNLDMSATLAPLGVFLNNMTDGLLPLVIDETSPQIMDASAQAKVARQILSAPLMLHIPKPQEGDPPPFMIDQDTLARLITIQRVDNQYKVGINNEGLRSFLENLASKFDDRTENARFTFNADTHQLELLQPAKIGRTLDIAATIQEINQQVFSGNHDINLVLEYTNPQVDDNATAADLGIRELVSARTTYFYGSSAERIQNIQTAAARFHGVLVAPGETFSMANILGDVSLDNGYAEALIIYGNRTIKGVGGGVCQVSTTLFRTAFFGGYPIVERHQHAYRVTYYELTRSGNVDTDMAGLDATVYVPVVDFKFTNDTPNWLLMETYVNVAARSLTWRFYSTSDGRSVDWETSGLQNIVEPDDPVLQENPDLSKNEIKQVDWAVDGADISVTRTVMKDGQVYIQDTYNTHYIPWRAVYEYGPGTDQLKLLKKLGLPPFN